VLFSLEQSRRRKDGEMSESRLKAVVTIDGAAILDIERNSISTLNRTGAFVWQGLQREQSLESIIAALASETGEDTELVELDVRAFVQELQKQKLSPR
jgi:hypothetical protein